MDLENLISDQNRSVATYAITTLLKVRSLIYYKQHSTERQPDRKRGLGRPPHEADHGLHERD